jgi:site-specific DNA-cytosine methylase
MSIVADNLQQKNDHKERYFLELFSGSKQITNVAKAEFNYKTFTIDFEPKFKPDLTMDILKLPLKKIPHYNKINVVWASVPCTWFSILNIKDHWNKLTYSHRQYYYIPKSPEAIKAVQILEKTIWVIKKINPQYWFIENPRGALRHMPQMNFAPFLYTVSYNDFGAGIYKPTDIFTNHPALKFPKLKTAVGRKFENSIAGMNNSFERSKVPAELIQSILNQIE